MNIYRYLNNRNKSWRPIFNTTSRRQAKNMGKRGNEHGRSLVNIEKVFSHPYNHNLGGR